MVLPGVWSRTASKSIERAMKINPNLRVTVPEVVDDNLLDDLLGDDKNA